jgi:hypothetical protein
MDIRKAYLRRSKRQARLHKRLAVAAVLAASAGALVLLQADEKEVDQEALAAVLAGPAAPGVVRVADQPMPAGARRVYPYSIVPGGLNGRAELVQAVMADKVVAAHYAGFAVHKASLRSVGKPRAVYVSYRKGGQVYWTSKKVMLAEGETLLSDGEHDIRARCGNRIADTPQLPVEVKGPGEQELDTAVEQAADGDVRQVAYAPEDDAGTAQAFVLGSFPNGAGLASATQTQSSASQTGAFKTAPDWNGSSGSYASSAGPVSTLGVGTASTGTGTGTGTAPGDTGAAGGESASTGNSGSSGSGGSSGIAYGGDSGGSRGGGDPGVPLAPGSDTGGAAGDALIADGSKPPMESLRPDGLPTVTAPAKEQAVPEPGSLWLAGLAAAGLLLRRRRRAG